jgi:RNA polymerase sigma-70 factor (ECF subfamily)
VARRDPLADTPELIRRIYSYVAYRVGDGPDAEDVTSEVFERALRYRKSYDPSRGEPLAWLIGIARRCVDDAMMKPRAELGGPPDLTSPEDLEADALQRLTLAAAMERLDERSRDLVALRYGADLSARQIGEILGMKTNAVEVALHRTLARLRPELEGAGATGSAPAAPLSPGPASSEQSERASGWA